MSDIRVEGLEKLMKQLKDIREDSDAVVEKGLLRGAERVCAAAKLRCPVSSGALRNSIHTEFWRWQDAEGNWHTSHGQAAQPFLRPAAAAQKENVIRDVNDEIRSAINGRSE